MIKKHYLNIIIFNEVNIPIPIHVKRYILILFCFTNNCKIYWCYYSVHRISLSDDAPFTHTALRSDSLSMNPSSIRNARGFVSRINPRRPNLVAVSGLAHRFFIHIEEESETAIFAAFCCA